MTRRRWVDRPGRRWPPARQGGCRSTPVPGALRGPASRRSLSETLISRGCLTVTAYFVIGATTEQMSTSWEPTWRRRGFGLEVGSLDLPRDEEAGSRVEPGGQYAGDGVRGARPARYERRAQPSVDPRIRLRSHRAGLLVKVVHAREAAQCARPSRSGASPRRPGRRTGASRPARARSARRSQKA